MAEDYTQLGFEYLKEYRLYNLFRQPKVYFLKHFFESHLQNPDLPVRSQVTRAQIPEVNMKNPTYVNGTGFKFCIPLQQDVQPQEGKSDYFLWHIWRGKLLADQKDQQGVAVGNGLDFGKKFRFGHSPSQLSSPFPLNWWAQSGD